MDRLEAMNILVAAADTGSLSAASRQLRVPLATVSRRVAELEAHLGARLLHRGARKLILTDAGRDYVASSRRIIEEIAEIERRASGEYQMPRGELVMSAPAVLGRLHLLPVVNAFLRAFPDIRMRLQFTDRHVNLVEEHVDLAMRVGALVDSDGMIATRIGAIRRSLCASPAYLEKRGIPRTPADLAVHDCLLLDTPSGSNRWRLFDKGQPRDVDVPSRLSVNLGEAVVAAAADGAGIAPALSYLIEDQVRSGALVRVLEDNEPPAMPANIVYASHHQPALKLRAFLDFAVPRLRSRLA